MLDNFAVNYNPQFECQQVTYAGIVQQDTTLNEWVSLKAGDIVYFKQTLSGFKHPNSTASYILYINGSPGGISNIIQNFDVIGITYRTNALEAFELFYQKVKLVRANVMYDFNTEFTVMVRPNSQGIDIAYKYSLSGEFLEETPMSSTPFGLSRDIIIQYA